jgi:hypothetical protein
MPVEVNHSGLPLATEGFQQVTPATLDRRDILPLDQLSPRLDSFVVRILSADVRSLTQFDPQRLSASLFSSCV